MEYSSNGKGNLGVTLGAIGTGLGALNGGLGNLLSGLGLGGGNSIPAATMAGIMAAMANPAHECCSGDNRAVNRYEAAQQARISELETEVKLRDANTYTLGEVGKLRDYMEHRFDRVEHELCDQKVYNATNTGAISCIQGQIAQLMSLTKLVVPNSAICPGWGDVTVSVTPATTA